MDQRESKLRGRKHVKNKSKYKDKSKIPCASSSKDNYSSDESEEFQKRPLEKNWNKYRDVDKEPEENESTDFSLLAKAPISLGGHFQFKSDKNLDDIDINEDQLFKLDLCLISKSLASFPLTKRCNIPRDYFTDEELLKMEEKANSKRAEYFEFLTRNKESVTQSVEKKINDDEITAVFEEKLTMGISNPKDDKTEEEKELEEWLDDFLIS